MWAINMTVKVFTLPIWTDAPPLPPPKIELSGSAFEKKGLTNQPPNKSAEDLVLHSGFFR